MPLMGLPGTEFYYEAFLNDESLGIRTIEMPDDTDAWQYNSSVPSPAPDAGLVTPPRDEPIAPGQWFWIDTNAISECWRWWDTQRTTPCVHEQDPNGMAALAVTLDGWDWGDNFFAAGNTTYTAKQLELAAKINSRHICSPVFLPPNGLVPCELQYQSPIVFDPAYQGLFAPNAYYGFAIQVTFGQDRWRVFLHIRVWTRVDAEPTWEPWTSRALTSGLLTLFGLNGRLMNAVQFIPNSPYASRQANQYEFDTTMFNTPAFGPFGLLDMGEGNVTVTETTPEERGTEPPLQGPLDMPIQTTTLLITSDGSTPSVNTTIAMPFGTPLIDGGGWWKPLDQTDRVVVPPGVLWVRGSAACRAGNSNNSQSLVIQNETNPWLLTPTQRTKPDISTEGLISMPIPRLPVTPGDLIRLNVTKPNSSLNASTKHNWLYLEGYQSQTEPFSSTLVEHDIAIPPAGTQFWMMTVPDSLDNFTIDNIGLSLGSTKSPANPVQVSLGWIRAAGRVAEDITDDPIQIDADSWTNDNSSAPYTLLVPGAVAKAGDIMIASILAPGLGGTGLIINFELFEPQ